MEISILQVRNRPMEKYAPKEKPKEEKEKREVQEQKNIPEVKKISEKERPFDAWVAAKQAKEDG